MMRNLKYQICQRMNKVIYPEWFFNSITGVSGGLKTCLILCLFIITGFSYGQYCQPSYQVGSCITGDYIAGVQFNTINNQNATCPPIDPNYEDFSATYCTSVCPGASYQISITNNPNDGEYMAVCIDLDGNGDFAGPGEFFPIGYVGAGSVISANIIIPQNATPGSSKLRVFCQAGIVPLGQSDVCGNLSVGEAQDYCLTINPVPFVNLGNSISQCGGTVTLNAGNSGSAYLWSDGSTTQTLQASVTGAYGATVTNSSNCVGSSSVQVYIKPAPVVYLGNDITTCGGPVTLKCRKPRANLCMV